MLNDESVPQEVPASAPVESPLADLQRPRRAYAKRFFYQFSLGLVGLYAVVIGFLLANETRLVYPIPPRDDSEWSPLASDIEEMWAELANGWRVHGWFLDRPDATRVVLYCHGNAEDVAGVMPHAGRTISEQLNASVLVFDYPGYGLSEGTPFEDEVLESGSAALTWLCRRAGCQPQDVILYGRSLGGGVAVALAQRHGTQALVLDRTFDSITSPGAARYPWAPVKLLMRNRYPSAERIAHCAAPVFMSHFVGDEVIPIWSARRLYDAAGRATRREFMELPGGHHLAPLPQDYWERLGEFLQPATDAPQ